MKGVSFDGMHSYNVFGMILNSYEIGEAEPNYMTVSIPGADGVLDYTEYFGDITYKNRDLKFEFTFMCSRMELNSAYAVLQAKLHGRKMKVILDDDKNHFYSGRVSVGALLPDGQLGTVTITANCEPYHYALESKTSSVAGYTNPGQSVTGNIEDAFRAIFMTIHNNGTSPVSPMLYAENQYYLYRVISRDESGVTYDGLNNDGLVGTGWQDMIPDFVVKGGESSEFAFVRSEPGELKVQAKWLERGL